MSRRVSLAAALAIVVVTVAPACGTDARVTAPPPALPRATVPPALAIGGVDLVLKPNLDRGTRRAFLSVGAASLVADAGVWELRKADKLVGALEVVTLDPSRSDTRKHKDRNAIRAQILAGDAAQLDVDGLPVWSAKDGDRSLFVWYGRQVLSVLQVKSDEVDAEETMTDLVNTMTANAAWPAMSLDVFDEDSE